MCKPSTNEFSEKPGVSEPALRVAPPPLKTGDAGRAVSRCADGGYPDLLQQKWKESGSILLGCVSKHSAKDLAQILEYTSTRFDGGDPGAWCDQSGFDPTLERHSHLASARELYSNLAQASFGEIL